jgi:tetratricopeptide (TPR) repeat protein
MSWLDRALELDPENGAAQKERGLAAVKLGDVDGALDAFARACEQLPEDFESHYTFAALMLQQQPSADAPDATAAAWEQAVVDAMVRAYVLSPRTGEEQLLLQQQIQPFLRGDPDSAFNLAMTLNKQGRGVLALFWLQQVVEWRERWEPSERAENLVKAFTMSGSLYLAAGKPDEALEAFRNAVLSDPSDFRARFELGDLLYNNGDSTAAAPHLRRALELFEDSEIAPEMRDAVRGTLEKRLAAITAAAGPPSPGQGADSDPDE